MKNTEEFVTEAKTTWNKLKTEVEQLQVQLALGRNEAKDVFEREWKKFAGFLDDQSHRIQRRSYWASHLLDEMGQRAGALKNALKQAAPDNEKTFSSWRENVLRIIYELEFIVDKLFPVMNDEEKELLSSFRIKMEVYRTQLVRYSFVELPELNTQAANLADKADDILVWRDRDAVYAQEKFQQFGQEISTSFDHMKKAFQGLFG
jgi:hypothetical protein